MKEGSGRSAVAITDGAGGRQCARSPRASVPALAAIAALALVACGPALTPSPPPRPAPTGAPPAAAAGDPASVGRSGGVEPAWLDELAARQLMVPVDGIAPERIPDTFLASRSGNRLHRAVDILAPRGTAVLSADDGKVLRLSSNALGGTTIYALDPTGRFVYYYAHLQGYRDGLMEGQPLRRGDVIGYVGTSGNAPPEVPHLHFQVMRWRDDGRWWDGIAMDPRPHFLQPGQQPR
jgi:murein DD-endopeptidase MepM/ murein hydrolase activator NlpD